MTEQTITVKKRPPDMNLTLVVTTMTTRREFHFSRGDKALAALWTWDRDPFTREVVLTNRIPDPEGRTELVVSPFGRVVVPRMIDALVWKSTGDMPRWCTQERNQRMQAELRLASGEKVRVRT